MVMTTLMTWKAKKCTPPRRRPSAPPAFQTVVAKMPVQMQPTTPPTPWQPHTSRASSRPRWFLSSTAM